jgi:hypothetical protein
MNGARLLSSRRVMELIVRRNLQKLKDAYRLELVRKTSVMEIPSRRRIA